MPAGVERCDLVPWIAARRKRVCRERDAQRKTGGFTGRGSLGPGAFNSIGIICRLDALVPGDVLVSGASVPLVLHWTRSNSHSALMGWCLAVVRAVGIAHTSPSSHGKLSQYGVAENRRIAFAVARKGDDAFQENFSFFLLIVGQVELVTDLVKSDRHRLEIVGSEVSAL